MNNSLTWNSVINDYATPKESEDFDSEFQTLQDKLDYIHDYSHDFLVRDKSGTGWICPICGSGSGHNGKGTGMTESRDNRYKGRYTCWSGHCFGRNGYSGDIIDMYATKFGLSNREVLKLPIDEIKRRLY